MDSDPTYDGAFKLRWVVVPQIMDRSGRGLKWSPGRWNSRVEVGSVPRMMELSGRGVLSCPR